MKKLVSISVFALFLGSLLSLGATKSFFTDTEKTTGNVLSVATEFAITPTPTAAPTLTPTLPPTPTPTPSDLGDHIVISEIRSAGNTAEKFIELYNPTDSPIDISSWSIQSRGSAALTYEKKNFESGNSVPAYGFFLIGHMNNQNADMKYSSFSLSGTGGTIFLVSNKTELTESTDAGAQIVDKVAYGTGSYLRPETTAFTPAPTADQSIERKAYSTSTITSMMSGFDVNKGNAYDSGNNANDFVLRTTPQPQNTSSSIEIP